MTGTKELCIGYHDDVPAVPLGARHHSGYVYSVEDTTKHSCELRSSSCLTSISHNPKR